MRIDSRQNPIVKRIKSLHAKKGRQQHLLHLAEGEKIIAEAVSYEIAVDTLFVRENENVKESILGSAINGTYTVSQAVMEALCDTQTPQGICAAIKTPDTSPPKSYPKGMLVALDTIQDPGNLGAILRTADAMGAAGVLLSSGCADPFSPKAIRAAMGSTYHLPIWQVDLYEALQRLHDDQSCCICGHLQGKEQLPPLTDRCVIVIGNEGNGVHEDIAALCALVRLPIQRAESLNASIAAGLLMYEVAKSMHILS